MGHRNSSSREKILSITSIHILALDGIVNVNSLFTVGVFIGFTWNLGDPSDSLVESIHCAAGSGMVEEMVKFHVYSFSSFLFSSLIALGLKQGIRITSSKEDEGDEDHLGVVQMRDFVVRVNLKVLQSGILASALGSIFGCVFLTLALMDFVQIKLGKLGCGSWHSAAAVVPLLLLVPSGLVIYIYVVLHAFTR
ncbi:OLC1v1006104C1 [Oldenlandia corymbosa var. corymbosa]|uniref:OLC1v1006104C1 n=1 Tax=Oldenlandia corymbosa var. corymbosa TaxID=529605 RepID=A0AAV1DG53_OLDCO|nr:OLC1v1006104C1 [Oldenlandia corymbosa var. corymbosa]